MHNIHDRAMISVASSFIFRKLHGGAAGRWKGWIRHWPTASAASESPFIDRWKLNVFVKRCICTPDGTVVEEICRKLLRDNCFALDSDSVFQQFEGVTIRPYHVREVLKRMSDVRVAMRFFEWVKLKLGFVIDQQSYSMMIDLLGKSGNLVAAKHLFLEMSRSNCGVNVAAVNSLIKSFGDAHLYDEAFDVFKQMGRYGLKADSYTFATIIDLLTSIGCHNDAKEVFSSMKKTAWNRSPSPNPYIFNSLINSFKRCGDIQSAMECFEEMKHCSIPPTCIIYSSLIDMQGKKGKIRAALDLFRQYLASHLRPDLVVYNSLMHALGRSGRVIEADALFLDIQKVGLIPDVFTYCILVSAWGRDGSFLVAQDWFHKMLNAGVKPNVAVCNALVHAYLGSHMLELVGNLLTSMQEWGIRPTLQTYNYLLNYYRGCKKQRMKRVQELMHKTGHLAHKFFGDLLSHSRQENNLMDFAKSAFQELRVEHHNWTREFSDSLIDFLHDQNSMVEAHCIWEAALASKLYSRGIWENLRNCWYLWLLDMQVGTALVALNAALIMCREKMLQEDPLPLRVIIITNWKKSRDCKVSNAVKDTLKFLESPFQPQLSAGRFICKGSDLESWLHQPRVEAELAMKDF